MQHLGWSSGFLAMASRRAVAFNPGQIIDLKLWLDASDAATIIESGGFVSQWNDKSGNDNDVTQPVGSRQPLTGTENINGSNVINFDGSNDFLRKLSFSASISTTMFFVARPNDEGTEFTSIFTLDANNDFQIDRGATLGYRARFNSSNLGVTGTLQNPSAIIGPTLINYRLSANDATVVLRVDGAQTDVDTNYNGALDIVQNLYLARNRAGNHFLNVDIGEVVIYNRDLTPSEIVAVEVYLSNKWGIALP